MKHKPLSEQVVVVAGASSGIGLATARMAARRGARVVLTSRSAEALAALAAEIEAQGGHAVAVAGDVGRRADVERIAATALSTYGRIDTWVNVAGQTIYGPLRAVSDEDHQRLIQTNFWGTVYGSLVAIEHLGRAGGALINVGSLASDLAFPFQGMYSASKHAVKGFTDALRMELRLEKAPVSVTLIKPTSIDTPLPRRARNYMDREPMLPPPVYPPDEVANAILHAAVHPQRDIIIGGAGKVFAASKEFSPSAFDRLAPAIVAMQKRTGEPRRPAGALHAPEPENTGEARGDQPGYVMRTSAYTRASLHPVGAVAGLIGLGLAAAVLLPSRRAS